MNAQTPGDKDGSGEPPVLSLEFWRLKTVVQAVGFSRSEIYRRIRLGEFPKGRKYAKGVKTFWLASDIIEWQRQQLDPDEFDALLG